MQKLNRRNFMTLAGASGAVLAADLGDSKSALAGTVKLQAGGRDFSPATGKERQAIPTACWGCVTRDAMMGFVEDGRLMKLEGHPESIRTEGVLCAKGQAGINQVYFPDRIL
ncbi:MAG: twin-arginine translocation signal domain-containing protein, partial [Alphaproteobacteria bacterium]|nr:twin-arginine translocation signal domain-containing protein [Alphaproteobacteria bacterium]